MFDSLTSPANADSIQGSGDGFLPPSEWETQSEIPQLVTSAPASSSQALEGHNVSSCSSFSLSSLYWATLEIYTFTLGIFSQFSSEKF